MSDMLFMSQIPEYLRMKYSVRRTRRAISYWTTDGYLVRGKRVYLKTKLTKLTKDYQRYTRKEWVDRFIDKVSRRRHK